MDELIIHDFEWFVEFVQTGSIHVLSGVSKNSVNNGV